MGRKTKQDIIDRQKKQLETYEEAIERLQKNYHEVLQKEDDDFRRSPFFFHLNEIFRSDGRKNEILGKYR